MCMYEHVHVHVHAHVHVHVHVHVHAHVAASNQACQTRHPSDQDSHVIP